MTKRWIYSDILREREIPSLAETLNVNPSLARILLHRGISDFDSAKAFFRPDRSQLHDPFLMKDMTEAVERLIRALDQNERILIYGDYDVDGTTSVALVLGFLKHYTSNIAFYINDRADEGYGISEKGVNYAHDTGVKLIITLDCGIKAGHLVDLAAEKDIDFIICDHHTTGDTLPAAVAVLDPKRSDCDYPFKELSGCGVGFKLMEGLCSKHNLDKDLLFSKLDLLAVSIAADIVPMLGENRVFCFLGLIKLRQSPTLGLKALLELSGHENISINTIVFGIAPRINAAGRIAHAQMAVDLLVTEDNSTALELSKQINSDNTLRRDFDSTTTQEALEMIESYPEDRKTTVLFKKDWHKGVVGIVASRCIEHYHRPTIILTGSNGSATGSARSVPGFDIYEAIDKCSDLLDKFGGHKYAAGLTLSIDKLEEFSEKFESIVSKSIPEEFLIPPLEIDSPIEFDDISTNFVDILEQMEPFGPGNPCPVFETNNVYVLNSIRILKEKHLKFIAGQKGNLKSFEVIGFGMAEYVDRLKSGAAFKMAYSIEYNYFRGSKTIQFKLRDLIFES